MFPRCRLRIHVQVCNVTGTKCVTFTVQHGDVSPCMLYLPVDPRLLCRAAVIGVKRMHVMLIIQQTLQEYFPNYVPGFNPRGTAPLGGSTPPDPVPGSTNPDPLKFEHA